MKGVTTHLFRRTHPVNHALKEHLYELWEQELEGFQCLVDWIADAEWSEISDMQAFAKTLRK